MDNNDKPLLNFPCEFPIKIVGRACETFEITVLTIINKHVSDLSEGAIRSRNSSEGTYTSITITVNAQSQAQLDAIYRELSAHEDIIMVL